MYFTGISDESGKSIETQIKAHQTLGWNHLELRVVDQWNLASMPEDKYQIVREKLADANMQVSCFASGIANWSKKIDGDFSADVNELNSAIPRMHELGIKFVRIMSYPNADWSEEDWSKEAIRRIKELSKIAENNDVILVHENCSGWASASPENSLKMIEQVNSPALKLVYDTGNGPGEGLDSWDFYNKVKEHIIYVHIKDAKQSKIGENTQFTYPGEGDGYVKEIVTDLLKNGYDGGFSIEPHLAAIIHLAQDADNATAAYNVYLEYGRRFKKLIEDIKSH
ncbi:sugar phosphate isomerase/epimerase [candidate division KSB1 bacterium]|nr:sugar phosphate isomerase/epimerase [candidate division KSB1 bacterium]